VDANWGATAEGGIIGEQLKWMQWGTTAETDAIEEQQLKWTQLEYSC